jgi:hypothetical protein
MAMGMDELPRQGVRDLGRGALFREWPCLNGGMAFDPAPQVFWKNEGLSTALARDQCAIADSFINCRATSAGNRTRLSDAVCQWNVHLSSRHSWPGGSRLSRRCPLSARPSDDRRSPKNLATIRDNDATSGDKCDYFNCRFFSARWIARAGLVGIEPPASFNRSRIVLSRSFALSPFGMLPSGQR